jgi:uncharacterized protein (TIGR02145 family)
MKKLIIPFLALLFYSNYAENQTLGGYLINDFLVSAVHPNGCNPAYVTGLPDDSIWVNFNNNDIMTGNFGMQWVNRPGDDLLLETGYNRSNYHVRLHLTNGLYSVMHNVLEEDWIQMTDTLWNFVQWSCERGSSNLMHYILPLDFQSDFGLTSLDTVTGIEIEFLFSIGAPDLAGVYIIQQLPCDTVHLGNDTSICNGESLLLKATKPNSTYLWQDHSTSSTYPVTQPGTYWVRVTEPWCISSDTIVVSGIPEPTVTNSQLSDTICTGESTNIAPTSNATGAVFTWTASLTFGNVTGFVADTGLVINQVLINHLSSPGIVTYQITPHDGNCTGSPVLFPVTVTAGNPVTVTISASINNICSGTWVTYTANPVNPGTNPVYQWYVNGIPVGTNSPVYSFTPNNGDLVSCTLTSSATCIANNPASSNTIFMTVNPLLPVSVSISGSSNPVCSGTPVTFTAMPTNGGNSPSYQWKVNGSGAGMNSSTFSYSPAQGDIVTCTLTSSENCTSNNPATGNPVTMTVNPLLPVGVSIAASSNPFCVGKSVTFTVTPVNGGAGPSYQWKVNGSNAGINSSTYSYNPVSGDIVTCTLISNESCTSGNPASSNALTMIGTVGLPAGISITASPNPFCPGSTVTCTATPVNGGVTPSYQWILNGVNTGTNSPVYSFNPIANDSIRCVMTSNLSCVSNNPAGSNKTILSEKVAPVVIFTTCFDTITTLNAKPFKLKGGIPLGGTYSGPGVNSSTGVFTPSTAGMGLKTITYSYTNVSLCSTSKNEAIRVQSTPSFTCGDNLTDIRDNKVYPTVQIGSQCWMARNLNYGTMVYSSQLQGDDCISEKFCYNDLSSNCSLYGGLYRWDELMQYDDSPAIQGLCPPGWHIPTEGEFSILFNFYSGNSVAGKPLQDMNIAGFRALTSGVFYQNTNWSFIDFATLIWSSTSWGTARALSHGMNDYNHSVSLYPSSRANAFPVRCLRD